MNYSRDDRRERFSEGYKDLYDHSLKRLQAVDPLILSIIDSTVVSSDWLRIGRYKQERDESKDFGVLPILDDNSSASSWLRNRNNNKEGGK